MKSAVVLAAAVVAVAFAATSSEATTPAPVLFAADRSPTLTGEIYRLGPHRRINLSRSPYYDSSPAVSSDGRHVAFISNRSGGYSDGGTPYNGLYEVGINGGGLVAIARRVRGLYPDTALAWQPHGQRIAAGSQIFERGHRPISLPFSFDATQPWSPDGRVLVLIPPLESLRTEIRAVSPQGRTLWTKTVANYGDAAWSSGGLLAVSTERVIRVYDEAGNARFRVPLSGTVLGDAWSPDGSLLAVLAVDESARVSLQVRTANGGVVLEKRVPSGWTVVWAGDSTVVTGSVGVNVRTGAVRSASARWLDPLSRDRTLALVVTKDGPGFALGVAPTAGGPVTTYGSVPGCFDETHGDWESAVWGGEFAAHAIVYESWSGGCAGPFADLYSIGAGIHRLTNSPAGQTQPVLSPDGGKIAYVLWPGGNCADNTQRRRELLPVGCSYGLRIANADGTHSRTLTNPSDYCYSDREPAWSPDGSTILYAKTTNWPCRDSSPVYHLWTVPATGGTPHPLGVEGSDPAWGPTRIAYDGTGGLTTANPDGSDPELVAKSGYCPAWSTDGRLAYLRGRGLVVGSSPAVKLPFAVLSSLAWTPDGTRLLVSAQRRRAGPSDLYSVKPNGTGLVRLTKNYGVAGRC